MKRHASVFVRPDIGVLVAAAGMGNGREHEVKILPVQPRDHISQDDRDIVATLREFPAAEDQTPK